MKPILLISLALLTAALTGCSPSDPHAKDPIQLVRQRDGQNVTGDYGPSFLQVIGVPSFKGMFNSFDIDPGPPDIRIGEKTYEGTWQREDMVSPYSMTCLSSPDVTSTHYVNRVTAKASDGTTLRCAYNGNFCAKNIISAPAMVGVCQDDRGENYTISVYSPTYKQAVLDKFGSDTGMHNMQNNMKQMNSIPR